MTRVLVVDDHPVFRRGISSLLEASGFDVVAEAAGAEEAVEVARRLEPDIVIMDLGLPDGTGVAATEQILASHPRIRIVVVTLFDDDGSVRSALAAGASAYVVKDASHEEIIAAIRAVEQGAVLLGSSVSAHGPASLLRAEATTDPWHLTPREMQVLDLMSKGLTNRMIADRLGLSGKTIANNVSMILSKLGVADRVEASRLVRETVSWLYPGLPGKPGP